MWNDMCQIDHQSSSATLVAPCWGCFSVYPFPVSYLSASSYSFLSCSCWLLMASKSRAINKSTSSFHSSFCLRVPLKIMTYLANIQKTVAIALGTLLLQGITISTNSRGASVLQRAIVGMLTYEASTTA
jgi:hypothetical protein